jgi:hypothetical protein
MDPAALIAGMAVASIGYVFAYRRKGRVVAGPITGRRIELQTPGDPAAVFDAIAAIGAPYAVDDAVRETRRLVLSSRPSIWSYGFLYPVAVHALEGGGARIEVGVFSRLFHLGPGMGRAHVLCARAIEQLLTVPPARLT